MLTVILSATDDHQAVELHFEHSLLSLSKWESIHQKPFFGKDDRTYAETASYIKCMSVDLEITDDLLNQLSEENVKAIGDYINDKQSATWFRDEGAGKSSNETITSELIYYWLVQFNIPFETQYWHLSRLMTLIKIAGIKQTKPKQMSKAQQAEQYRKLNAERRAALGSTG